MKKDTSGITRYFDYYYLFLVSAGFAALAWILDSLLDSLVFHERSIIDQIINPSGHDLAVRLLFGSFFIIFGIYIQSGITRSKKAEDALKAAVIKAEDEKNKTKDIIEAIGDGIILQDTDYKIIYQNNIQNEVYGNRVGEYCYKAYEGRDTICEDCPIEASFIDGKIHKAERRIPTDQGILYIELTGSPLRDSTGKIIGGIKVVRNITGLKRIEETLRESEEKYRVLFEASPVGIGIADLNGNVLEGNQSMQEMTGFTLEELRSISVSATYVDPDERKVLIKNLQETGRVRDWEIRLRRKDGTIYYALLNADLLELRGKKVLLTTSRDITERKQLEEKLREGEHFLETIFSSIQDGIGVIDKNMKILKVNQTAKNWYPHVSNFMGRKCYEAFHGRKDPCQVCPSLHTLKTGKSTHEIVPKTGPEGTDTGWLEIFSYPMFDTRTGKMTGVIEYVRDITDRKRTEEAIKKYAKELEEANQLKDLFTDIIRHDLLNPLTVIKGFSEILSEDEPLPQKRKSAEAIIKNVGKLEEMIQSAATLARVEAMDKLDFEERNLCEIIRKVISDFTPLFNNKGMSVEFYGEEVCVAEVNPHIEDIFSNLLSNTVKYSPENTIITVEIKADKENWLVSVKDRGNRIPDEYKKIIFERFKRIEKRGVKGSGLGLSIVKRIVDIHKGKVWVEDNPGGGNIFLVMIPAKQKQEK